MSEDASILPRSRTWPYLNTPLHIYLSVMLPICGLMGFLVAVPHQTWVRLSAAAVIVLTLRGLLRGYVRRLVATADGVAFKSLAQSYFIAWKDVAGLDIYIPSGGVNGVRYVYVTGLSRPPHHRHEIDSDTVQVQDRPGLLEELREFRARASN